MTLGTHAVKVKRPTSKVWLFLTPSAGTTRLRIHASMLSEERARELVLDIEGSNPGVRAKAVPFWPKR